jgi:hypothetical protein
MLTVERTLNVRAMSAGTMLSIAITHIFPECSEVLTTVTKLPLGAFLFLIGMLLMYGFDLMSKQFDHIHDHEKGEAQSTAVADAGREEVRNTVIEEPSILPSYCCTGLQPVFIPAPNLVFPAGGSMASSHPVYGPVPVIGVAFGGTVYDLEGAGHGHGTAGHGHGHAHDSVACTGHGGVGHGHSHDDVHSHAHGQETGETTIEAKLCGCVHYKKLLMAFALCAHSIVLGISLGLTTDRSSVSLIMIVFVIHQLLEALCISHSIGHIDVVFEKIVAWTLMVLSMPTGVAIGLIVWASLYKDGMRLLNLFFLLIAKCI